MNLIIIIHRFSMNREPERMANRRMDHEIRQIQTEANTFLQGLIDRDFPDYVNCSNLMFRGISYAYFVPRSLLARSRPPNHAFNSSMRIIGDDLFEREDDSHDQIYTFHLRDGSLAVKIESFILQEPLGLVDLPPEVRLYRAFYYYRSDQPIHATVSVIIQSPTQALGLANGPVY